MAFYPKQWSFSFCFYQNFWKKTLNFFIGLIMCNLWVNMFSLYGFCGTKMFKLFFSLDSLTVVVVVFCLFYLTKPNQTGKNLQNKPIGTDRIGCVIWLIYIGRCCIFNTHFYVAVSVFHLSLISTNYLPHFRTIRFDSVFRCA